MRWEGDSVLAQAHHFLYVALDWLGRNILLRSVKQYSCWNVRGFEEGKGIGGVDGPVFVTKQEWITRESTIYTLLIKSFPQKQAMLVRQLEDEVVKAKTHASQTNPEVRELIFTQRQRQTNKQTKTKTRCTPAKPIQRWETEPMFFVPLGSYISSDSTFWYPNVRAMFDDRVLHNGSLKTSMGQWACLICQIFETPHTKNHVRHNAHHL